MDLHSVFMELDTSIAEKKARDRQAVETHTRAVGAAWSEALLLLTKENCARVIVGGYAIEKKTKIAGFEGAASMSFERTKKVFTLARAYCTKLDENLERLEAPELCKAQEAKVDACHRALTAVRAMNFDAWVNYGAQRSGAMHTINFRPSS